MQEIDSIERSLFASRIEVACDEMGAQRQRSTFLPNICDQLILKKISMGARLQQGLVERLANGRDGEKGANSLNGRSLPAKCELSVVAGD